MADERNPLPSLFNFDTRDVLGNSGHLLPPRLDTADSGIGLEPGIIGSPVMNVGVNQQPRMYGDPNILSPPTQPAPGLPPPNMGPLSLHSLQNLQNPQSFQNPYSSAIGSRTGRFSLDELREELERMEPTPAGQHISPRERRVSSLSEGYPPQENISPYFADMSPQTSNRVAYPFEQPLLQPAPQQQQSMGLVDSVPHPFMQQPTNRNPKWGEPQISPRSMNVRWQMENLSISPVSTTISSSWLNQMVSPDSLRMATNNNLPGYNRLNNGQTSHVAQMPQKPATNGHGQTVASILSVKKSEEKMNLDGNAGMERIKLNSRLDLKNPLLCKSGNVTDVTMSNNFLYFCYPYIRKVVGVDLNAWDYFYLNTGQMHVMRLDLNAAGDRILVTGKVKK